MAKYHEDTVIAGTKILRKSDGAVLATFSSLGACAHAMDMLRAGYTSSAKWATNGATTAGDRTIFDALPKLL